MSRLRARLLPLLALLALAGCATHDPNALWRIVQGECLPHLAARGDPAPCAAVDPAGGWAALKDRRGIAQYLLIPTARVSGIEDPALLAPGAPDYFAAAWRLRPLVEARLGRPLPRAASSLALNSAYGRSQNEFHIHVDCARAEVQAAIAAALPGIGPAWAPLPVPLGGRHYLARRLDGETPNADPIRLLAEGVPGARQAMGEYTLVVLGVAGPGFVLLTRRADLAAGDHGSGEELQDHGCRAVLAG